MEKFEVLFASKPFGPVRLIGLEKRAILKASSAKELWDRVLYDGIVDTLQELSGRVSPDGDLAGWMGEYDEKEKTFSYIVGVFTQPGSPAPEGFTYRDLPACLMGIGRIRGRTGHLEMGAHNKTVKVMRAHNMEPDYSQGYSMEYYPYKEYGSIEDNGENIHEFQYYLPCKPK